jgi:hypothetical protein
MEDSYEKTYIKMVELIHSHIGIAEINYLACRTNNLISLLAEISKVLKLQLPTSELVSELAWEANCYLTLHNLAICIQLLA